MIRDEWRLISVSFVKELSFEPGFEVVVRKTEQNNLTSN